MESSRRPLMGPKRPLSNSSDEESRPAGAASGLLGSTPSSHRKRIRLGPDNMPMLANAAWLPMGKSSHENSISVTYPPHTQENMDPTTVQDTEQSWGDVPQEVVVSSMMQEDISGEGHNGVSSTPIIEVKMEMEEVGIAPNESTSSLYERLSLDGLPDPSRRWFATLGLPYCPHRVRKSPAQSNQSRSSRPQHNQADVPASAPHDGNPTVPGVEEQNIEGGETYYSASTATQAILIKHCDWEFVDETFPSKGATMHSTPKRAYLTEYQTSSRTANRSTLALEESPTQEFDRKGFPIALESRIENNLNHESYRLFNEEKNLPRITFPEEWSAEANAVVPPFFPLPLKYRKILNEKDKHAKRRAVAYIPHSISDDEDSPTDIGSPPPQKDETPEETKARNELTRLCDKYKITSKTSERKKKQLAKALKAKLDSKNLPHYKIIAKRKVAFAIANLPNPQKIIKYEPRDVLKARDKGGPDPSGAHWNNGQRCGDVTDNEHTRYIGQYPPEIIANFLSPSLSPKADSEQQVDTAPNTVWRSVITGRGLKMQQNVQLKFPISVRPMGSNPQPDLFVRASELRWHNTFWPVLFAAECKTDETVNVNHVRAQLATYFHSTLVILILYYLDTRKNRSEYLPPWLFLYGIEYTEFGFYISAHYPAYDFEKGRWKLRSKILSAGYGDLFKYSDPFKRLRFLSVLYRMRSHCAFVLKQLRKWDTAEVVLKPLLHEGIGRSKAETSS